MNNKPFTNRDFTFQGLLAKTAPEPQASREPRAKYDFAVAYPDPSSLPLDELAEALSKALQEEGSGLALYPHSQGYPPLRDFVAKKLEAERDIKVSGEDILLGDGSSQPLHMIIEALVDPGDVVLTESYVYSGTLSTLRRFRADVRGVACDEEGLLPDAVEDAIGSAAREGKRPKFIYTIPTFQNPQGWTMTLQRRRALVGIGERFDVPILEDDCYVDLRYDGDDVTSIRSLDGSGRVMYVGSFSKIIAPGMRLGYVATTPELLGRLLGIKGGAGVNQFASLAVHRYATSQLGGHIDKISGILRAKRDAMLAALGECFGPVATWSQPEGGLYIWLRLPEGADLVSALPDALEADVGYHPGPRFAPDGVSGRNYARLCFGYNSPEEIGEGVARLAEVCERRGMLKA